MQKIQNYHSLVDRPKNQIKTIRETTNGLANNNCKESIVPNGITSHSFDNVCVDHLDNVSRSLLLVLIDLYFM